jgi:membrane associated rhomboid family serine protease
LIEIWSILFLIWHPYSYPYNFQKNGGYDRVGFEKLLSSLYDIYTGKLPIKKKFPWAMFMMSVVQLSMFWCDFKYGKKDIQETFRLEPCLNETELWRPVTYMFAHANWDHLLSNIVTQLLSVSCLEAEHEPPIIYLIYFVGGLMGGFGHLVWNWDCTILVGCSGGVFALVAANLSYTILVSYFWF